MNLNPKLPQDANNNPYNRSMGIPICCNNKIVGSAAAFRDMIVFPQGRVFFGIMVENPSSTARLEIAIGDDFADQICMSLLPQGLVTFDNQTFGAYTDEDNGAIQTKLRAKLSTGAGTLASGTLTYVSNPTDGQTLVINGITYEWSSDGSTVPGRARVPIGGTASGSYGNLQVAIMNYDPNLTAVNGSGVITITSNFGGTDGNTIGLSAGTTTGATASGATLTGGSGGVTPIIHIW